MRERTTTLEILSILRSTSSGNLSIANILRESKYMHRGSKSGKVPMETGAIIFGDSIIDLIELELIRILNKQGKDITSEVTKNGSCFGKSVTYSLRGKEEEIFFILTDQLIKIQRILGYSLSQKIEELVDNTTIFTKPIFGRPQETPWSEIFVLMPFDKEFTPIYEDHILKVALKRKLICYRADNIFASKYIMQDIWNLICNSKIIIADCTFRNPNVFYELGIAHTMGKQVIVITQNENDIPFDIRHIRYIKYDYTIKGMILFEEILEKYLEESGIKGSLSSINK